MDWAKMAESADMKKMIAWVLACCMLTTAAFAAEPPASAAGDAPQDDGVFYYSQIRERLCEGNQTVLSLLDNKARVDALDREKAYDDLLELYNGMTDYIWAIRVGYMDGDLYGLKSTQESLEEQLEALKEEEYAKTYQESIHQIDYGIHQIVMAAQNVYTTIISLEQNYETAQRGYETMARNLEVSRKMHDLGMMSQMDLIALENQAASIESQVASLEFAISSAKDGMKLLIGDTGEEELVLSGDLLVSPEQLQEMKLAEDTQKGLDNNLEYYNAKESVEDLKETLDDTKGTGYKKQMAQKEYDAAVHSMQNIELTFRQSAKTLYQTVQEKNRLLTVAKEAQKTQEQLFSVSEKKFQLGMISKLDYQAAEDSRKEAQQAVDAAELALFQAYQAYDWVQYGIASSAA